MTLSPTRMGASGTDHTPPADGEDSAVTVRRDGAVAVVVIRNPPVNALSFAVREPLGVALAALRDDPGVEAVVISCSGRTFVAGADIKEFGKPLLQPDLRALIALLEALRVPSVAAIHGTALGGGLELALGCSHRVASRDARLGLPEVTLGLLPGAGGTLRLPALIGPVPALEMIVSGKPVDASDALRLGLVDEVAEGEIVEAAVAFAKAQAVKAVLPPPVRERRDMIAAADLAELYRRIEVVRAKARGLDAPLACAEAVRNAATLAPDEALRRERELFLRLLASDQSRAQRHLFFAERQVMKSAGPGPEVELRPVRRVGIVGAGTMGGGIAMAFADAGFPVMLLDQGAEALARGTNRIEGNYDASVRRGSLAEAEKTARMRRIATATDLVAVADCDLVIEAVFEDMDVKSAVLAAVGAAARPGAVIATNTSYLDIDRLAHSSGRPTEFAGAHFFSPANVMRLLEIVRGCETSPAVLATLVSLARCLNKVPVVVGNSPGFVGNRMLKARTAELEALLLEGASVEAIDGAFADFGWPMGPFAMADLAGLDIGWRNRRAQGTSAPIFDWLCEQGRFGQKSGGGFYVYGTDRSRTPDPELGRFVEGLAVEKEISRRAVGRDEIIERTHYPLVNEGARILEEGIAARASDIDLVWVHGYGFPRGLGGPMHWAERLGFERIAARIDHWYDVTGREIFRASDRLRGLASDRHP